ncbi:MAG: M48 family metallopeptidase [Candidatus Hadarchaeales archaeon]
MSRLSFYDQISKNKRNSILLVFFILAIVGTLVYLIGYLIFPELALIFLIFATLWISAQAYLSFKYGASIVLKATNARPADPVKHIYLINTVEGLSLAAGIPAPKVYVVDDPEINAFACGTDPEHACIAVTTGALENLNRQELEGVVGHEISHVKNYDVRYMTMVAVFVGLAAILSYMFLRSVRFAGSGSGRKGGGGFGIILLLAVIFAIFAPIASRLVQAMISRRREYLADAESARLTRYPEGLASALEKIKNNNMGDMKVSESISHLFISDPNRSALDNIFATHPPIEKRIEALRSM